MMPASPERGFLTATTTMFGQKQALLKRILLPVFLRQHPSIVECTSQSLLRRYRLYIEVGSRKFVHLL
jgi:hypothetical protein